MAIVDFATVEVFGLFIFWSGGEGRGKGGRHRKRGCEIGERLLNEQLTHPL